MGEALPSGTVVSGYRIHRLIGRGGMGTVYEATQLSLERKVALKILSDGLSADESFRTRFRREGRLQAQLEHPNIVTVYEAGEAGALLFLAMRLIRGASLKDILRSGPINPARAMRILGAIADALVTAHNFGLVHRDIKPQNILLDARDHPYLADFGITKGINDITATRNGQFMGSLDYVAPEEIRAELTTAAADVYALTAVLFECLTGVVPFAKETEAAVLFAHLNEAPPKPSTIRADLPPALDQVIAEGMAKYPDDRPSANALIEAAEGSFRSIQDPRDRHTTEHAEVHRSPKDHRARSRSSWVISRASARAASLVTIAAATVGAGFAIGHGLTATDGSGRLERSLSIGSAAIKLTGAWRRTQAPRVPGLSFGTKVAASSTYGTATLAVLSEPEGRYLLPAKFKKGLASDLHPDGVRLGEVSAYRYKDIQVKGFPNRITLLIAPTTAGAFAFLCVGSKSGQQPATACETSGSSLRLTGPKPLPLGANSQYAEVLARAVAKARSAAAQERSLSHARTRAGQSRLSLGTSRLYAASAAVLAQAKPGPDASATNARLLSALRLTASEYAAMSEAARRGDSAAFHAAATRRLEPLRSIRSSLAALRAAGYT